MALFGKKGNSGAVGEASRFRTFGIFLVILVLVLGGMFYAYQKRSKAGITSAAAISGASRVKAVGATETISPEFSKLVREKNIQQAEEAARTGKSAVATVVRPSYFDSDEYQGRQVKKGCSVKELRRARAAGVSASELRCLGCPSAALKAAEFTAAEMRAAGFSAQELRVAGFNAAELKTAGYSASDLKAAGFDVSNLAEAGFTAAELSQAGFSPDQLRFAGYSDADLAAAGVGIAAPANLSANSSRADLVRAKQAGVSAAQLRKNGIGAVALRDAGYTAEELKAAGFSTSELKAAGFDPAELKAAGYSAASLLEAGYTAEQLKKAGYTAEQLRAAGATAEDLVAAGFTREELKKAGYSDGDLLRAGLEEPEKVAQAATKCDVQTLRNLRSKGIAATSMVALGCNTEELKSAGFTEDEISGKVAPIVQVAADSNAEDLVPTAGMTEEDALLAQMEARQERQLSQQERKDQINRRSQIMRGNASALMSNWVPPAKQEFEEAVEPKEPPSVAGAQGQPQAAGSGARTVATGQTMAPTFTVKAGTIMFGVLDTGINSDEDGSPVLATIVEGKFKGSRLVGRFQLVDKRLLISFDKLAATWLPTSSKVNIIAIDPDTARTAIASHVDNHYFLRYGTLFASSFLSGLSTAVTSSGSQTSSGAGGIVTTTDPLNTTEKLMVALGEVGTQYASVLGENFKRKPTVTVEAGQGVGLLFREDTQIELPSLGQTGGFQGNSVYQPVSSVGQQAAVSQQVAPSIPQTLPVN